MIFEYKQNELDVLIEKQAGAAKTDKLHHGYTKYYYHYFKHLKEKNIKLLEIGTGGGGSLRMWRELFPKAEIHGMDIVDEYKRFEEEGFKIHIGNQLDEDFILRMLEQTGPFDIIIDDGGHYMTQQIGSFKMLYEKVNPGGSYVIEDLFSSYDGRFMNQIPTTMDFIKELLDFLHKRKPPKTDFEKYFMDNTLSVHMYEKIIFFFKNN